MDSTVDLQELVHHRCALLSVRRANVRNALRILDIRCTTSDLEARQAHGQSRGLFAKWHMGHNRSACLRSLLARNQSNGVGVQLQDKKEDLVLHGQLDHTHCAHQLSQHIRVLLANRRGRENDLVYIYFARLGCVSLACVKDFATHVNGYSVDIQVLDIHVDDEHCNHFEHGDNHQLELSHTAHTHHAQMGTRFVHRVLAQGVVHAQAGEFRQDEKAQRVGQCGERDRHAQQQVDKKQPH